MIGSLRIALRRVVRSRDLLALLIACSTSGIAFAQTVVWQGDDAGNPTDWSVPGNWDTGTVPGVADNPFIDNGRPATISSDVGLVNDVHVSGGSRLNVVAGGVVGPNIVAIGDVGGSSGQLVQSGGLVDGYDGIRVGINGGTGNVTLSGGQLLFSSPVVSDPTIPIPNGTFLLGDGGTGTFDMTGGELRQVNTATLEGAAWNYIGRGAGQATFNLSDGIASFNARTHISDGVAQATVNQTGGRFEVRNHELIISDTGTGGGKGTYNLSGGELHVQTNLLVGHWVNSTGELNASGGKITVGNNFTVGNYDNANGIINVSGTADIQVANEMHIGNGTGDPVARSKGVLNQTGGNIRNGGWGFIGGTGNGDGEFNLSAGTFTNANRFHVGGESAGRGVLNQTGGTLRVEAIRNDLNEITNAPDMLVGDGRSTTGVYNLSGGTATIDREMIIGHWANTDGTVNVSGTGDLSLGGPLRVGGYTNDDDGLDNLPFTPDDAAGFLQTNLGKFNQSSGTVRVGGDFSVGAGFRSTGVHTMTGGTLEVVGGSWIGDQQRIVDGTQYRGTGTFNMSGGVATFRNRVGIGAGGSGTLNQTGGRIEFASTTDIAFHVGDNAVSSGVYNLSGGEAIVTGGRVMIGHWNGLDATMNVSGTGLLRTTTDVHVGSQSDGPANKGVLNQTGGSVDVGGNLIVAFHVNSTGDINLSAGELHSRTNVLVGDAGLGTITQTGGTHIIEGDLTIGVQASADGLYTLDGGVLDMTGGSMSYGAGLAKQFAFEGGTLKNAGTINFDLVNSGGTLAPGASPGTTNIIGAYTITNAAANYQVEIAGTTPGTGYDVLNVSGIATLGGKLEVLLGSSGPVLGDTDADNDVDITDLNNVRNNFAGAGLGDTDNDGDIDITDLNNVRNNFGSSSGGFVPNVGDSFTVLTAAGGRVGTFASTSLPVLPAGRAWGAVQYLPNNVRLNVVAAPVPVPEPSTLGLGCVLLAGAGWWVRRQKRR